MKMRKKEINMFNAINDKKRGNFLQSKEMGIIIISIVLAWNLISISVALGHSFINAKTIKELNEFLAQPQIAVVVEKQGALVGEISNYQKDLNTIKKLDLYASKIVGFETTMYSNINIAKPQTVTIRSFSYYDNTIQIDCTTRNDNPPADYTKALERTGLFEYVSYKGFSSSEDGIVFPIVCKMKGEPSND